MGQMLLSCAKFMRKDKFCIAVVLFFAGLAILFFGTAGQTIQMNGLCTDVCDSSTDLNSRYICDYSKETCYLARCVDFVNCTCSATAPLSYIDKHQCLGPQYIIAKYLGALVIFMSVILMIIFKIMDYQQQRENPGGYNLSSYGKIESNSANYPPNNIYIPNQQFRAQQGGRQNSIPLLKEKELIAQ